MSTIDKIQGLASTINSVLTDFYEVGPGCDIKDFIYLKNESSSTYAETVLDQTSSNLFLGILVSTELVDVYATQPCPSTLLKHDNLGLFSVVAEEVSHFRQLYFIAENDQQISKFDLELQSEFDKIIAAMLVMHNQTGDYHCVPLARLMFDSTINYANQDLYERSGNIAAQWWWNHLNRYGSNLLERQDVCRVLKEMLYLQGEKKMDFIRKTFEKSYFKSA